MPSDLSDHELDYRVVLELLDIHTTAFFGAAVILVVPAIIFGGWSEAASWLGIMQVAELFVSILESEAVERPYSYLDITIAAALFTVVYRIINSVANHLFGVFYVTGAGTIWLYRELKERTQKTIAESTWEH